MFKLKRLISVGLAFFFVIGCASKKPVSSAPLLKKKIQVTYNDEEEFPNLDAEYATYIVQGEFGIIMRKSFNILTMESTQEDKEITVYWRDIAMLFLGVEAEEQSQLKLSPQVQKKRWENITKDLQYALMKKFVEELNSYIRKDDESQAKQSEISQLRHDLWSVTQKQLKLEKLLKDLEKVK